MKPLMEKVKAFKPNTRQNEYKFISIDFKKYLAC